MKTAASETWFDLFDIAKIVRFAGVSGSGLVGDSLLFLLLVTAGLAPFHANLASASAATAFVYFASMRKVFFKAGPRMHALFCVYCVYQALAIFAASAAVGHLITFGAMPLLAKMATLPITFSCNYLFLSGMSRWLS